jgi:hypothetical protein
LVEGIFWNSSASIQKNDGKDETITSEYVLKGNQTEQGIFKFFINALSETFLINKTAELTKDRIMA